MKDIRNIYCIGRNYVEHIHELGNEIPEKPIIFSKPTHALVCADGNEIQLPKNQGDVHYEAEIVLKMNQDYEQGIVIEELVQDMTIGLDLTLRDVQSELKAKGHPWLIAKGFNHSAIIGKWIPFKEEACKAKDFTLMINGEVRQKDNCQKMIFPFTEIIHYIGSNLGLKKGDIIFTGTPKGVGALSHDDKIQLLFGDEEVGTCTVDFE